jgi:hypothetical protein
VDEWFGEEAGAAAEKSERAETKQTERRGNMQELLGELKGLVERWEKR